MKATNLLPIYLILILLLAASPFWPSPGLGQDQFRIQRSGSAETPSQAQSQAQSQDSGDMPPTAPSFRGSVQSQSLQTSIEKNVSDSQPLQANVEKNVNNSAPLEGSARKDEPMKEGLTEVELKALAAHDIVLLIDKSGSMMFRDCPIIGGSKFGLISSLALGDMASQSRWDWCLEQTSHMARATQNALSNGFSVVLFDDRFMIFPHVTVEDLRNMFRANRPGGGTDLATPLGSTFGDYFRRRQITNGNVKPLLVGIITDGCPNDPMAADDLIRRAVQNLRNQREVTVILFLIGSRDRRGENFAREISRYGIVKSVPFNELLKVGLAKALADNLQ